MDIPMPDGKILRFRMEETRDLGDELRAQFPSWKTFAGQSVDDPSITGRFDFNLLGFHGYIFAGSDTVMIDPYQEGDTENYLVFYKRDFGKSDNEFFCNVEGQMKDAMQTEQELFAPAAPAFIPYGSQVRTYKLAIATTGEWARAAAGFDGSQTPIQIRNAALAKVQTAVTRLNGIYLRELASLFQLVNPATDTERNIIFDNPENDPYANTDSSAELRSNQNTLDARVLTANYDIGHLFGTGGGGLAATPALCDRDSKAEGYSARGTQTGDPFVVDYVAHEMGHQFGSDHTYNNIDTPGTGACPLSSYSAPNAYEPGSGSSIMSYVGICGARNLQQNVDFAIPAFHIRSLTVISNNIIRVTTDPQTPCGTASGTTNNIPSVSAGNSYRIPKLTPFTLKATGGDTDNDSLLYSWEEYDRAQTPSGAQAPSGPAGDPAGVYDIDSDGNLRPIFRVYSPVTSNSRTFPSLPFILNPDAHNDSSKDVNGVRSNQPKLEYTGTHPSGAPGAVCENGVTCVVGERLPEISRPMNFRVSVRDGKGGVADAGTTITIAATTTGGLPVGPFQVTTQNSAGANLAPQATWTVGSSPIVTWDVANTNVAPVSATNVNILLSTDGGQTFPIVLKANTPNDGNEQITVPNNTTSTARIKVEAVDNIFFDINNANFTIAAVPTAASVNVAGRVLTARGRGIARATVMLTDQNGNIRTARANAFGYYNFADIFVGQTYIFTVSAKGYQFEPRFVLLMDGIEQLNFIAQ
jgi:hypothetical protein